MEVERSKRLFAWVLDGSILCVTIVVAVILMASMGIIEENLLRKSELMKQISASCFCMGIFVAVNGKMLATSGQTIGKRIVGIKIVDEYNLLCPLPKILILRYFLPAFICQVPVLGHIFFLIDSLYIFKNERRCFHDIMAGTKVVYA